MNLIESGVQRHFRGLVLLVVLASGILGLWKIAASIVTAHHAFAARTHLKLPSSLI